MGKKSNIFKLSFLAAFAVLAVVLMFCFFAVKEIKAGIGDNVSGWAWSENIGWISFNCNNSALPEPRCTNDYGVYVDPVTGVFSGYAWSENIGWIRFYPGTTFEAKLDLGTNKVSGWAKACAGSADPASCTVFAGTSGWDGWIKMRKNTTDDGDTGPDYGVNYAATCEFSGWAWGSDVVGWVSFSHKNCDINDDGWSDPWANDKCPVGQIPYYLVKTDWCAGSAPYLEDLTLTCPDFCSASRLISLGWTYKDGDVPPDPQEYYTLQVATDTDPGFNNIVFEKGAYQHVNSGGFGTTGVKVGSDIDWGGSYYWRVKVLDENNDESEWFAYDPDGNGTPDSFTTPIHAFPDPEFTYDPEYPGVGEIVTFTDQSECYSGDCYADLDNHYLWDFDNGSICDSDSDLSCRDLGYTTTTFPGVKTYKVKLIITDNSIIPAPGQKCTNTEAQCWTMYEIPVSLLPQWKEIAPISWIGKFLANLAEIFNFI